MHGVIQNVDEPTSWCAGMVRICVDFRKFNESVLREVHPIPKVDDTLAKLAGATTFSKQDTVPQPPLFPAWSENQLQEDKVPGRLPLSHLPTN